MCIISYKVIIVCTENSICIHVCYYAKQSLIPHNLKYMHHDLSALLFASLTNTLTAIFNGNSSVNIVLFDGSYIIQYSIYVLFVLLTVRTPHHSKGVGL